MDFPAGPAQYLNFVFGFIDILIMLFGLYVRFTRELVHFRADLRLEENHLGIIGLLKHH